LQAYSTLLALVFLQYSVFVVIVVLKSTTTTTKLGIFYNRRNYDVSLLPEWYR
jgi:hypothetical protein